MTSSKDSEGMSLEGRTLGGFRLSREIACGGMATVYLAHKAGPGGVGQAAAVKVIHPHLSRDREFVDMFLDEARIVACVNHPGVCRVLDFGKGEGTYYLAMEYVLGETWSDLAAALKDSAEGRTKLPGIVTQILAQACEGLHAAHEAMDPQGTRLQIVHRDISPQNILVGYDGTVRVLDFGIASAAERLHTTRNGTIKGRFAYMSPEQMRGGTVDRRADIWSLGVLLWEGLARERLFKRDNEAETVLAVTNDPLPSLARPEAPIPLVLQKVVTRALSRERDKRYPTAREMGLELSRFASASLVPVGPAELSLWMQRLFADRIEYKRQLLRDSARASIEARPISLAPPPPVLFAEAPSKPFGLSAQLPSISAVREVPRASRRPVKTAKIVGGAIISAVVAAVLTLLSAGERTPAATAASQPSNAPAPALTVSAASAPVATPAPAAAAVATPGPAATPVALEPPRPSQPAPAEPQPSAAKVEQISVVIVPSEGKDRRRPIGKLGTGTLDIATPGYWMQVFEGAQKLGTAPGRLTLAAGVHTLTLRPFGQTREIVRDVEIKANATTRLTLSFD